MPFRPVEGKVKSIFLPKTASQAMTKGACVEITSAKIDLCDDNDTQILGVIDQTIASTDSDYSSTKRVKVVVPCERLVLWEATGQSGFSASDVGGEFGIQSSLLLDQTDTTNKVFMVKEFVDAATVRGFLKINGSY